jgi:hypothetical protein
VEVDAWCKEDRPGSHPGTISWPESGNHTSQPTTSYLGVWLTDIIQPFAGFVVTAQPCPACKIFWLDSVQLCLVFCYRLLSMLYSCLYATCLF